MKSKFKIGPGFHDKKRIVGADLNFSDKANIMLGSGFSKKKTREVLENDKRKAYSRFD